MKNSVRRKRGDGENIFLEIFSLPSFISWSIQIPKRETLVKESNDSSSLRLSYAFSPCHELAVSLHRLGYVRRVILNPSRTKNPYRPYMGFYLSEFWLCKILRRKLHTCNNMKFEVSRWSGNMFIVE